MQVKFAFSNRHLISATISALEVKNVEEGNEDSLSERYEQVPENVIHNSLVAGSVISSFAYAESYINEAYDAFRTSEIEDEVIDDRMDVTFDALENALDNDFTKYSTLKKYQFILTILPAEEFDRGANPYQDMNWLRYFRNYLVHFEPEWITLDEASRADESKLENALRDRVDPNPLIDTNETEEQFLPRLGLSYSSCRWAIDTTLSFVKEFQIRIGDNRENPAQDNAMSLLKLQS